MSGTMKTAAASVNKGNPSTFYSGEKTNPVLRALEQDTKSYVNYMKKRAAIATGKLPANESNESSCRHSDTLFELWNKYEPKLPKLLYQRKLLEMGDLLVSMQEYSIALWLCYGRYLKSSGDINVEEVTDVQSFKETFFPDGFDTEDAGFTFRALMGKTICSHQVVKKVDPKLQSSQSVDKCVALLNFLRLVTQVVLPKEDLCWLVYNGTIHMYRISRHLMSLGHSAKVLEYVLWACMCMESSVPLLAVKYLQWRSTLYTAVCQCYFDCKAGHHAEAFARRALSKINELSQLESMSDASENKATETAFRHATIKMAVMVFKRTVFETRRKPKGLLRPKTRANLKDAAGLPWPRTQSEKLLVDMFEGSSSQALCIVETLSDSNRRTLISSQPASDSEVEILDVFAELFMAAQEIIAGGGGSSTVPAQKSTMDVRSPMGGLVREKSLMDMAACGEDGIPLSTVVKIVKLAYCYEQWDALDTLLGITKSALKEANDPRYGPDEKALELLAAYDKAVPRAKHRKLFQHTDDDDDIGVQDTGLREPSSQGITRKGLNEDNLIQLSEVLLSIVNGPYSPVDFDVDMVIDACLHLWSKCKTVFQRYQTGATDNHKYLQKMDNPSKWVYVLDIVHQVLGWSGLSSVDPALTAEVVLRLALVYEASAQLETIKDNKKSGCNKMADSINKRYDGDDDHSVISSLKAGQASNVSVDGAHDVDHTATSQTSLFSQNMLSHGMREQLLQARDILEIGLQNVSYARHAVALTDGKNIADVSWDKELNKNAFAPHVDGATSGMSDVDGAKVTRGEDTLAVWNTIKDLNVEIIFMYHRICLKLAALGPENQGKSDTKPFQRKTCSRMLKASSMRLQENYIENFDELVSNTNGHGLSRSLLLMQRAAIGNYGPKPTAETKKLLDEAMALVKKVEMEERRLYIENTLVTNGDSNQGSVVKKTKVPPAPLLLYRTDNISVFRPAHFNPSCGQKVAWYRLFARNAAGNNVKVRLNDYYLPGTGEEVPSFHCELRVTGLTPGMKYVYAVSAYTAEGKLIGDSIGESTHPILASHPLSVLINWAYLSQVAYQVGYYGVSKDACDVLWHHFVAKPPPPEQITYIQNIRTDFELTLHRLNQCIVSQSSPVLLRMFLTSIFINVDIHVQEGQLFCDKLCDSGPLHKGQIARLQQCERMLVALELSGWLNESHLALQAIVQCYGLLAPLIHFQIPAAPVIQVLERCSAILQEIPVSLWQKRAASISDGLHHMTACLTYHMTKVLRLWGQRILANNINDAGRKLLAQDTDKAALLDGEAGDNTDTGPLSLAALKKKKTKGRGTHAGKDEPDLTGNEELKALEAHILRLSKQSQGEHELTGNEDPSILHAYIAYLPSRIAQKEVVKFKRRARYLEFFIQTAQKALSESIPEVVMEWCDDTSNWLTKRSEAIIGSKATVGKQPGATTIIGDDPKKFAAALVEYSKDATPRIKDRDAKNKAPAKPKNKKIKYKAIGITPNMTDAQKQQQEDLEIQALEILKLYFIDLYQMSQKRKKIRKISTDEMPFRAQFNTVYGLGQFGVFLQKLDLREKQSGMSFNYLYRTSNLEDELFAFETAGTLVVGWTGGPSRQHTQQGNRHGVDRMGGKDARVSAIEMAAAAATGKNPAPVYPLPREEMDSPRTYRSEAETARHHAHKQTKLKKSKDEDPDGILLSPHDALEMLNSTFNYLKKAIVLSHRGKHWTLLQNSCRVLWNCVHTALIKSHSPTKTGEDLLSIKNLRRIMWEPFCTAADCLLDMLVQLQHDCEKPMTRQEQKIDVSDKCKPEVLSCMGNICMDRGGADLKFETPLDDISNIDARWVKRMLLRTLELLYYEQKWERLVDLALRFNALSDDRFAEQVNPLLIQAQRKLINRIEDYGGHMPPQLHFQVAMQNDKQLMTAKQYTIKQLNVQLDKDNISEIDPGAQIDPEGHDAYGGGLHALQLSCVPLDVDYSLKNLRQALDKSNYSARALQHSRRLLILYLSGQTNTDQMLLGGGPAQVDFAPNTAKPQPNMPSDISKDLFLSMDDVQTSPLPRSQMSVIMTSYDKTIEMLLASNHKALASEAMRELANLHYHTGNIRGAYKWWSEALDMLLGMSNAIHSWRSLINDNTDLSRTLLDKCGLWGCVLGGVLASNIAQYVLNSDLGLRTECCFLSGYFFKALFRSSLPHPTADCDYSMYEVGSGCEISELIPGVDLLSERFRCDGRTLVAALHFILFELQRGKQNLFVLPLLTLYIYLTTFTCRDLHRSVEGRILKITALTDLSMYTEAFVMLQRLLFGDRLPHAADSTFRQVEGKMGVTKFNTSKPIPEPCNIKVLELCMDKRLSTSLSCLYGPHLTCQLSLAHAHLMITLASSIPTLPKFEDIAPPGTSSLVQPPPAPSKDKDRRKTGSPSKSQINKNKTSDADGETDSRGSEEEASGIATSHNKSFTEGSKLMSLEVVKGSLLATADQMIAAISEIVLDSAYNDKGITKLNASEIELVVRCKLEMAAIAQQRHHATMAARLVLSALKILQGAEVFKQKTDATTTRKFSSLRKEVAGRDSSPQKPVDLDTKHQYEYQDFQSRSRLDARLWLSCYLAIVQSLTGEVRGLGQIKGEERSVILELADVRQYCAEGIMAAEACGDVQIQCELMYQAVILNTIDGRPVQDTKLVLQNILKLLSTMCQPSTTLELLRSKALTHITDLEVLTPPATMDSMTVLQDVTNKYISVHDMVLNQLKCFGQDIEYRYDGHAEYSTPTSPLRNLYLPHLLLLIQLKMRIGYSQSRIVAQTITQGMLEDAAERWSEPLGILITALEISKVISMRIPAIEAELLLNIGKIERQLYHLGKLHSRLVAKTLVEAIKLSFTNEHDLSLMRQAYLELAVLYLASSGQIVMKENSVLEAVITDDDESVASKDSTKKRKRPQKRRSRKALPEDDQDRERHAAWVAIRCAASLAEAQRARVQLSGDAKVSSETLGDKAKNDVPEYMALDLLGSYVIGIKKRIYKNEIEEELAPLTEALDPPAIKTYNDQLNLAKQASVELSWIHAIGYQAVLQRLCSTLTMTTTDTTNTDSTEILKDSEFDISMNQDVVHSVIFSDAWSIRLSYLHRFMATHLKPYVNDCIAIYPPSAIQLPIPSDIQISHGHIICKTYAANSSVPMDLPETVSTSPEVTFCRSDQKITSPVDSDLSVQWYKSTLDENIITIHPSDEQEEGQTITNDRQVMLLCAQWNKKTDKQSSSMVWVSLRQLVDLHNRLSVLTQRGEISLGDAKPALVKRETSTISVGKGKKHARIKALSPKIKTDDLLEALLRQCMSGAQSLVGFNPEPEIPLEGATRVEDTSAVGAISETVDTIGNVSSPGGANDDQVTDNSSIQNKSTIREAPEKTVTSEESQQLEIPFEVTKANLYCFERMYDPSLGYSLRDLKMLKWFRQFIPST